MSARTLRWDSGGYARTAYQVIPTAGRVVVLGLHGHGGSGRSFAATLRPVIPAGVDLVCPDGREIQEPAGLRRGWAFPGPDLFGRGQLVDEDVLAIGALRRGLLGGYDRVILVGYSQGAALAAALLYSGLPVAGAAMIAGGPTPATIAMYGEANEWPGLVPVYCRIGDRDDRVPPDAAAAMLRELDQHHADVDAAILPGVTHRQAPQRSLGSLRAWLARVCA